MWCIGLGLGLGLGSPDPSLKPTLYPPVSSFIVPMVSYGVYGLDKMWETGIWSLMSGTRITVNPTKYRHWITRRTLCVMVILHVHPRGPVMRILKNCLGYSTSLHACRGILNSLLTLIHEKPWWQALLQWQQ